MAHGHFVGSAWRSEEDPLKNIQLSLLVFCAKRFRTWGNIRKPSGSKMKVLTVVKAPHQFSSVAQLCLTLGDPMDCSTPGLPVLYQLAELAQTHVHQVSDGTQSSHPLLFPLLPPSIFPNIRVFSNELFTSGSQSTGVSSSASVFPMNTQD